MFKLNKITSDISIIIGRKNLEINQSKYNKIGIIISQTLDCWISTLLLNFHLIFSAQIQKKMVIHALSDLTLFTPLKSIAMQAAS